MEIGDCMVAKSRHNPSLTTPPRREDFNPGTVVLSPRQERHEEVRRDARESLGRVFTASDHAHRTEPAKDLVVVSIRRHHWAAASLQLRKEPPCPKKC